MSRDLNNKEKLFIDYKFLGIKSFIEYMDEAGLEYHLFEEDDYSLLFDSDLDILKDGDSVVSGIMIRDDHRAFFSQFAIKITKSYRAYIVFIFDHHPTGNDLMKVLEDMEDIVMRNLDNVDLDNITDKIKKQRQ